MREEQQALLDLLVARLNEASLPAQRYTISGCGGFRALGLLSAEVECVEARLGPAPGKPGYSSYAVAQTFLPQYPSLALTFLIELRDEDHQPSSTPAKFGLEVDKKFSTRFLPLMHTALNALDPTGHKRGILVQSYNSEMTLRDFIMASYYSAALLLRFKRDGQLAIIAVDYYDRLTRIIASAIRSCNRVLPDIHLIPRTPEPSTLRIPIRGLRGEMHVISHSSTALDQGFRMALAYLDSHYQASATPSN